MVRYEFTVMCLVTVIVLLFVQIVAAEGEPAEQVLVYNAHGEPATIDPGLCMGEQEATLAMVAFEGLTRLDADNVPVGGAAQSWDISADFTSFTFHLRENGKWADGEPVTAHDFEYAWKRVLNPAVGSEFAYILYYIKNAAAYNWGELEDPAQVGVKAIDDYTLKVTLQAPCPYFLQITAHTAMFPVRRDIVEVDPDGWSTKVETYVGNGPFKMTKWTRDSLMVYEKNDHYWDADNVRLERLVVTLIDNNETATNTFLTGDIDVVDGPAAQFKRELEKEGSYFVQPGMSSYYYMVNINRTPWDNPLVRKALAIAINRQIIVEKITQEGEIPALAFIPYGLNDVTPTQDFRECGGNYFSDYDVEKAKELLGLAGYPNGEGLPPIRLVYISGVARHQDIALAVQQWWKDIGIETQLVPQEWSVYIDTRGTRDYDVAMGGWGADYLDPMAFLDVHASDSGFNDSGYVNDSYDALVQIAKMTGEESVRMMAMHEAERVLMEDMPIIPLFFYTDSWAARPYVRDVIYNPVGIRDFKYAWIAER
jgi:oligopeptide transport system substrate-binding protein